MIRTAAALALALAANAGAAEAGVVRGRVVVAGPEASDAGVQGGLGGVWVWYADQRRTQTAADGSFELAIPDRPGIVWARVPDGYAPGRAWVAIDGPADGVEITLTPSRAAVPLRFVHVSDAHIGKARYGPKKTAPRFSAADLEHALDQALAHDPASPPAFFVMTGDITNRETEAEIAEAASVLLDRDVPFVAVPGNHDWVAGGKNYRATFGPANYSFDAGGVHFVVLNDNWRKPPNLGFLRRDLSTVTDDRMVVVFVHRPPHDQPLVAMEKLGVDALFTGHWHSNRYVAVGRLRQINTEAIIRGGIDFTPAGYRIVTVESGALSIVHGTIVESAAPAIAWPLAPVCVGVKGARGAVEILASIEPRALDGRPLAIAVDGGEPRPTRALGGWAHGLAVELAPGAHDVALLAAGEVVDRAEVTTCDEAPAPEITSWSQVQGGAGHAGRSPRAIHPPLEGVWATAAGEHVLGGSPAIGGGAIIVPISDLDDGDGGGVIALDPASGRERWRAISGHSVRGTPAVAGDAVIFNDASGVVHAVDLATGAERWATDITAGVDNTRSALISAPAVDGDRVFAVTIGRLAAIDLATGAIVWDDTAIGGPPDANMSSRAAPAVGGGLVIATAGWGKGGMVAFDRDTGERRWSLPHDESHGVNGAPVIDGDRVLFADAFGTVRAVHLETGAPLWKRRLTPHGNSLSLAVAATPAIAGEILVVATQYRGLFALDATNGQVRWRSEVGDGRVHTAHDDRTAPSITSSPVITGDVVWFGGVDGVLRAVDLVTGAPFAAIDVGAPILSGPAPAGELLIVASYDGVVRALASGPVPRPRSGFVIAALLVACGFAGLAALRRGPR